MCVCVVYLFVHLFQDDLRYLFSPHQVNHGGVQKPPEQVSLYKSHTTEEPLRRRRSDRSCQVLSSHSGQVGKLFLILLPPHQRVCVVGHLLDLHVHLKLGVPFDRGHVEIHGYRVTSPRKAILSGHLDVFCVYARKFKYLCVT